MSRVVVYAAGLTNEEWSRRERVVRQFDREWRRGPRPAIDDYLPNDSAERRAVLVELVHTDLEYRLKDNEPARVEEYLARYPELGSDREAELGLIEAELQLRRRREPDLTLDEFLGRFPRHSAELLSNRRGWTRPGLARLTCPQCGEPFDVPADGTPSRFDCSACAARFRLASPDPGHRPSRLGKYELIEEVGRGQFGVVYRARDTKLERTVAVKVARMGWPASPGEVDWFFREARTVSELAHSHIVPVHDSGVEGGTCFIVSAFVPGKTLADRLAGGRPAPREAAELAALVADALHYAHKCGVVHRDVKPSNILLDPEGRPHLTDFGLAKRESGEITLTLDGELLGTPAYTSPEQARGEAHRVDGRSDVYSLGVVLYEMLTGERPFQGSVRMIQRQVIEDEPRPPRRLNGRVPADLETICLKCLAKEPGGRYPSAGDLGDDLRRFLDGRPILARPAGPVERSVRWCRRNPALAGSLAAFGLAVVVGFATVTWLWQRARREQLRAEENFRAARSTVDDYLTTVSRDVYLRRDLPGLRPFRAALLNKALAYYQQFARQHGGDRDLQVELAKAYDNIGLVTNDIGSKREAQEAYRSALAIWEAEARDRPDSLAIRDGLARTYARLGRSQRETGQVADAEASLRRALGIFRELVAARPDDAECRAELAGLYYNLGGLQSESGRPADAEESFAQARDGFQSLSSAQPRDAYYRAQLAMAHNVIGGLQRETGRTAEAERSYLQALEIGRALVADEPNTAQYLWILTGVLSNFGALQEEAGRRDEAERSYAEAVDLQRKVVAAEPQATEFHYGLAAFCKNLGSLQLITGRRDEAEKNLLEACGTLRRLVAIEPSSTNFQDTLASTLTNLGNLQVRAGRLAEAERSYLEARDVWQRLARTYAGTPRFEEKLAIVLSQLGVVLSRLRRPEEALESVRQAIALEEAVISRSPENEQSRLRLSTHRDRAAQLKRILDVKARARARAASFGVQPPEPGDPIDLYNAACELAQRIATIGDGQESLNDEQRAERRKCADAAMDALRRAARAGFEDLANAKKDPDLDPLRSREDFRVWLMDLAFPVDPFAR